jgi:uncharacterized protein (DUF305 family)
MSILTKQLLIAALSAAVVCGSPSLRAQEHEGHHPAEAAKTADPDATQAKESKMGCGMMGGDKMQKMMKMMEEMQGKSMGGGMSGPMGDNGPSSLALNAIAMKMHNAMSMTYTGNADVDFVKGMIPHHQAAIDMAKTVIAFGKDPQVKKLAEDVIKAQEAEITVMTEWIKKQSQPQP